MGRMGDVLAGIHSSWEFDTDSVLIRFERGIRTPKLFHVLGERRIPYEALSGAELLPGTRRGTVVLRLTPRAGADPLVDAAGTQLKERCDPYRLVLPADREVLAEYYLGELRSMLPSDCGAAAERYLVDAPRAPLSFKGYDGKAAFDGRSVTFRWFWTGASSAKWKAGDQRFQVGELSDVEWRSPEVFNGYLRLLPHGSKDEQEQPEPEHDPFAIVFGLGYGLVHESLPLAAAVLAAVRAAEPASVRSLDKARCSIGGADDPVRSDPADIAERIRHLGELHAAGLLTDKEFAGKKAELLAEL